MKMCLPTPIWSCPICEAWGKGGALGHTTSEIDLHLGESSPSSRSNNNLCPKGGLWLLGLSLGASWEQRGVGRPKGTWKEAEDGEIGYGQEPGMGSCFHFQQESKVGSIWYKCNVLLGHGES